MTNQQLAEKLAQIGQLYAVDRDKWRSRTYTKVAGIINDLDKDVNAVTLRSIEGIGESTETTIRELLQTGTCQRLEELTKKFPPGALALQAIPGVGPVNAFHIARTYKVTDLAELIKILETTGKDRDLLERAKIGLQHMQQGRLTRELVSPLVSQIEADLRALPQVQRCCVAGSFRRKKATVKDLDILVCIKAEYPRLPALDVIKKAVTKYGIIQAAGEKKIRVQHKEKFILDIDFLIIEPTSWGAALCYFTGSKEHNIKLRAIAKGRGLLINEYGFYRGDERIGGEFEVELYDLLGIPYIEPENREEN